jgi:hypothetical protein
MDSKQLLEILANRISEAVVECQGEDHGHIWQGAEIAMKAVCEFAQGNRNYAVSEALECPDDFHDLYVIKAFPGSILAKYAVGRLRAKGYDPDNNMEENA